MRDCDLPIRPERAKRNFFSYHFIWEIRGRMYYLTGNSKKTMSLCTSLRRFFSPHENGPWNVWHFTWKLIRLRENQFHLVLFIFIVVFIFIPVREKKSFSFHFFFFFLKKNPVGPVEYPQHFYFSHSLIFHSIRRPHTYTRICAGWGNGRVPFRPLLWQKYVGQRRMGRESLRTAEKETDSFWVLESKLEKIKIKTKNNRRSW